MARTLSEIRRADVVNSYASAYYNLTQSEVRAPDDVMMMLLHRLRAALRDGPCPSCPNCSLEHLLIDSTTAEK